MKHHNTIAILCAMAATATGYAGQEISSSTSSGKDMKGSKQVVTEEPLFKDHEFQMGDFAVYEVGNGPTHAGVFRNHAWGDGDEINYFFTRYIGIGAEYIGTYALESPDTNRGRLSGHQVDLNHVGGNLFFRYPIESLHLAPYAYLGGGADFGDRKWGNAYVGVGLEYRIFQHWIPLVAQRVGFFMDARWTYLGDRYFPDDNQTRGDLNYFTARAGFRFTY